MSLFDDVRDFHEKFGLPTDRTQPPTDLTKSLARFRIRFLLEEMGELMLAMGFYGPSMTIKTASQAMEYYQPDSKTDLTDAADALADLVYVALGTAHFMGIPFDQIWDEVQRANMAKERASGADDPRSKRRHASDVVKPEGWKAPDHGPILRAAGWIR